MVTDQSETERETDRDRESERERERDTHTNTYLLRRKVDMVTDQGLVCWPVILRVVGTVQVVAHQRLCVCGV